MTHAVTVALAVLGVAGQALVALALVALLAHAAGAPRPLRTLRELAESQELWLAFLVAAIATGGSLFFSEIANYVPCELCWFQRICMYPLSIVTLLAALREDERPARYLLPLPLVGAGLAVYQILVERGVVHESQGCAISAPGGCATRWIDEFGYMTIPTLSLTAFLLVLGLLVAASLRRPTAAHAPHHHVEPAEAAVEGALVVIVLGLVVAGGFVGWAIGHYAGRGSHSSSPAATTTGTGSVDGAAVFRDAACGSCHTLAAAGANGSVGPNLDSVKPSRALVVERVTNGKGGMPSFRGRLTAAQIAAVADYVAANAGG